ncbi:MAG: hypothetical protein JO047_09620 [Alphaproteobacteria bacterium]|nr:hypothetical protein [Alphaproteobacteria bacterium]
MRAWLDRLVARDPDLARIEAQAGPLPWRARPAGFSGLLQAIVAQQISNPAAAAIWRRLARPWTTPRWRHHRPREMVRR